MRYVILISILTFSSSAYSDEPSLERECKSGFKSYLLYDKAYINICPINETTLKIDAVSRGSNYHSCWWPTIAKKSVYAFEAKDEDCELLFTMENNLLDAEFIGTCRSHCGSRAGFRNGIYTEKISNK